MTSTDTDQPDVFSVYTVSWEVFNGARWEKTSMVATPNGDTGPVADFIRAFDREEYPRLIAGGER